MKLIRARLMYSTAESADDSNFNLRVHKSIIPFYSNEKERGGEAGDRLCVQNRGWGEINFATNFPAM